MPLKLADAFRFTALLAIACGGAYGSQPAAHADPSTTTPSPAPGGTPQCVGLSICPTPPPDAEGNPACYYSDGWQGNSAGGGIEVWYFHEPQNLSKPDKISAIVRKKDGTNASQGASIDAGQQVHRFEFPTIDKSSVQEVLLTTSSGRCFVIGPGS